MTEIKHNIRVSPETMLILWRARMVIAARSGRPPHTITHDEIIRAALKPGCPKA